MNDPVSGLEIAFIGVLIFAAVIFLLRIDEADLPGPQEIWETVMREIRRRSALVICIGAAIMLVDTLIFSKGSCGSYLVDLNNTHYLTLVGGLVALVGVYHWITASPPPQE